MRNPECEKAEGQSKEEAASNAAEAGFSEKELDLDIEVRAGEWQNLKKFKTYQQRSRQGKIIVTYQAVSNRLNQLVALYYKFVSIEPHRAAKLLEELRKLRYIQAILLNCLIWSSDTKSRSEGELKDMVPKEIRELIE